jgi:RNA polymerase sigma factor (sigma-70 family)
MEDVPIVAIDHRERRAEENRRISDVIQRERRRLFQFIRTRVNDQGDAEDILQDVFYELTEAYRLMKPVEQAGAWLYRVARNRIIDRFRKKRPEAFGEISVDATDDEATRFEDLLPSPDAGPEAIYARGVLLEELDAALEELPEEQRDVFIAHEIDGRGFKQIADETGIGINTLLSRKRYAVLHLRRRLQAIYEEFRSA